MKEVFFDRNVQKLFFANLFSGFGQGMTMIGISWHLVTETGSAKPLGTTMFVSAILMVLPGPVPSSTGRGVAGEGCPQIVRWAALYRLLSHYRDECELGVPGEIEPPLVRLRRGGMLG